MDLRKKILLVDDDADTIEFLTYNFQKSGFAIVSARDGNEGIEVAKETNPDIIIADVMMPQLNGIEMCRRIKHEKKFESLPFIFLSASGNENHFLSAMLAGTNYYEMKPIHFFHLRERVREVLGDTE